MKYKETTCVLLISMGKLGSSQDHFPSFERKIIISIFKLIHDVLIDMETITEVSLPTPPSFTAPHMYGVSTDINKPMYLFNTFVFCLSDKIFYLFLYNTFRVP